MSLNILGHCPCCFIYWNMGNLPVELISVPIEVGKGQVQWSSAVPVMDLQSSEIVSYGCPSCKRMFSPEGEKIPGKIND